MEPRRTGLLAVAVLLLAAAGLGFEVAVTSLFAVVLAYHYVSLAIAIGLLGFGLGALGARPLLRNRSGFGPVAWLAGAASLAMVGTVLLIVLWPSAGRLAGYALAALVPFACLGAALAYVYARLPERSALLYAVDLAGGALGVLLALGALHAWGGVGAALAVAVLPAVAAILLGALGVERSWVSGTLAAVIVAAALAWRPDVNWKAFTDAPPDKTMIAVLRAGGRIEATRWDGFGRTDLVADPREPDRKMLFIDGGAGSYVYRWDGSESGLAGFRSLMEYLPFRMGVSPRRVLIIGPGGGLDVLLALAGGATEVTAVEIDGGLVDLVRSPEVSAFAGGLFDRPGVTLVQGDGRNFAARAAGPYDLILLNLVYTQAAEARSFALTENYVFTKQAFARYLDLLEPGGHVAVISHSALEASRALLTGVEALGDRGVRPEAAVGHTALLMTPDPEPTMRRSLMILGRSPLFQGTVGGLADGAAQLGLQAIHLPGREEKALAGLVTGKQDLKAFLQDSEYDLSPTTDDRPFFFQLDPGMPQALSTQLTVALLLLAFVSWLVWGFRTGRKGLPGFAAPFGYFVLLGLAFMLVEIPLIQQAMLLLGSPQVSMAVVVVSLLLGGGLGAALSGRFAAGRLARWAAAAAVGAGVLALAARFLLPPLTAALLPFGLWARFGGLAVVLLPLGVLLGMPFPSGIRLVGAQRPLDIPLLYAVGGAASVAGSALAVFIAVTGGFSWAQVAGALLYGGAGSVALRLGGQRVANKSTSGGIAVHG